MKPIFKLGLLFFAALILMPGVLKSAHLFADHQHTYCDHASEEHLHERTVDCHIFIFQQQSLASPDFSKIELSAPEGEYQSFSFTYTFLIDHFESRISLRGPPFVGFS